jgi:hypothetical protein
MGGSLQDSVHVRVFDANGGQQEGFFTFDPGPRPGLVVQAGDPDPMGGTDDQIVSESPPKPVAPETGS